MSAPPEFPLGKRFGRLIVIGQVKRGESHAQRWEWECVCDCGAITISRPSSIRRGHARSCGCLNRDRVSATHRTHGMSHLPVYTTWHGIIQRCCNPNSLNYPMYGGRGIDVCERWRKFENFIADMGDRPSPKHSIERIHNDKGYSLDNCRWTKGRREQLMNTRRSIARRERLALMKGAQMYKHLAVRRELKEWAQTQPPKIQHRTWVLRMQIRIGRQCPENKAVQMIIQQSVTSLRAA